MESDPTDGDDAPAETDETDGAESLSDLAARVFDDSDDGGTAAPEEAEDEEYYSGLSDLANRVQGRRQDRGETAQNPPPQTSAESNESPPSSDSSGPFEGVESDTSVLFVGPSTAEPDMELCGHFLESAGTSPRRLVLVTFTESPEQRVSSCATAMIELPIDATVIAVGEALQPDAHTPETGADQQIRIDRVKTVADPADLMRLGIAISDELSTAADEGCSPVVCFHSLSNALQFGASQELVFRFLHILQSRLESVHANAHFHMDPAAHDETQLAMFRQLFDAVVRFDEDGIQSVER